MNRSERKLNKFIKKLQKQGLLDWAEKLQQEYPRAEIYLVGGAVRDAILNKSENKPACQSAGASRRLAGRDLDFVVRGVEINKLENFLSQLGWMEKLGKNFGVLKFIPKEFKNDKNFIALDIALPRSEFSTAVGGYKDFEVKFNPHLKIQEDLQRRDFTINAIAVRLPAFAQPTLKSNQLNWTMAGRPLVIKENIIDPFDGIGDINKKRISCVGHAEERLSEDYTRILRAVRFACQLNFKIEKNTQLAIKALVPHLNDKDEKKEWVAPREVIAKEFLKALSENHLQAVDLFNELNLFKTLMPEILATQNCPQPENYHSEGDVWVHTLLALKNLNSRKFKKFEKKLNKILPTTYKLQPTISNLELILALLFHDIGKPPTIQTPEKDKTDRIRFNDHDNVGAEITRSICNRLKLSAPEKYGVDCDNVVWLIKKHMILVYGHPKDLRSNTIEKYFFNPNRPGKNLIKLAWLDISATITKHGPLEHDLIWELIKRMKNMKKLVKDKQTKNNLPQPLLNGNEIMKICNIPASKEVGKIKNQLREKQLINEIKNKKQAEEFVNKLIL